MQQRRARPAPRGEGVNEYPSQMRPAQPLRDRVGRRRFGPLEGLPVEEVGGGQQRDDDSSRRAVVIFQMGDVGGLFDQRPVAAGSRMFENGVSGRAAFLVVKAEERRPVAEGGRE